MSFLDKMNKKGLGWRTCLCFIKISHLLFSVWTCSFTTMWHAVHYNLLSCDHLLSVSFVTHWCLAALSLGHRVFCYCPLHSVLKQAVQCELTAEGQRPMGQLSSMAGSTSLVTVRPHMCPLPSVHRRLSPLGIVAVMYSLPNI